jgi:hypothetical protein
LGNHRLVVGYQGNHLLVVGQPPFGGWVRKQPPFGGWSTTVWWLIPALTFLRVHPRSRRHIDFVPLLRLSRVFFVIALCDSVSVACLLFIIIFVLFLLIIFLSHY